MLEESREKYLPDQALPEAQVDQIRLTRAWQGLSITPPPHTPAHTPVSGVREKLPPPLQLYFPVHTTS